MPRKTKKQLLEEARIAAEETATPPTPELPSEPEPEVVEYPIIPTPEKKVKKAPKWIVASDLHDILEIMSKADKVSPAQVAKKLNGAIERGELLIAPNLGTKQRKQ